MTTETKIIWLIVPSEDKATILRIAGNEVTPFVAVSKERPEGDGRNDDETTLAQAIAKVFREQEYDAQPILLAPKSSDVLSVTLPPDTSVSRQAIIYELEEYFPIPAERFVADFFSHEKGRFSGVIDTEKFLPLIDELAAQEILVQFIVPLSILIAQHFAQHPIALENALRAIVWSYGKESIFGEGLVELFLLTPEGLPLSWQLFEENPETLRRTIEAEVIMRNTNFSVDILYLPESLRKSLETIPRIKLAAEESESNEEIGDLLLLSLAKQSELILSRKKKPWWDFCRDSLAMRGVDRVLGKSMKMVLWGSVALTAALCLVCFVRMFQYDRLSYQYHQEQVAAFREALPEQQLQTGFRSRLESEYMKMFVQRDNTVDLPERESVLFSLLTILQSLPKDVRYRFPEIRVEQGTIRLDGQLQVHGDAELIATALEKGGFVVEPPSTQQTGGSGVAVRLSITRSNRGDR